MTKVFRYSCTSELLGKSLSRSFTPPDGTVCCQRRWLQNAAHAYKLTATSDVENIKPFSAIPRKFTLPGVGHMFQAAKYVQRAHKMFDDWHRDLGPIVYTKFLGTEMVSLNDADDLEHFVRLDSKYPMVNEIAIWRHSREVMGEVSGVFLTDGEEWHRQRRILNTLIMKPPKMSTFIPPLNETARDLVELLKSIRGSDNVILNMNDRLVMWAFESIGTVLFNTRLGCLQLGGPKNKDLIEFAKSTRELFETSDALAGFPPLFAKYAMPSVYKQHMKSWDTLFRLGKGYVDAALSDIMAKVEAGKPAQGFLVHMLASKDLSKNEVYVSLCELMTAGVDTTSAAVQWLLYELSQHPEVQEKLYDELMRVVPAEAAHITQEHLDNLSYLKAVIKELLRVHPITLGFGRISQEDMVIRGYHIPKGTCIFALCLMSKNPKYFSDPESFKPERWLRDSMKPDDVAHAFASLPFGYGVRGCAGRRLAMLEMRLLLAHIVRRFVIKPGNATDVSTVHKFLLYPSKSVDVALVDRN